MASDLAACDTLIVYGARCVWWENISETANSGPGRTGIPLCPHCRSPLFQMEPDKWWEGVDRYEAAGHPGYRLKTEWLRGRCFPNMAEADAAYAQRGDND